MHTVILKTLLTVLTKIAMAACGEKVMAWLLFKVAEEMAENTKTTGDDEFVAMVKKAYEDSKERTPTNN